MAILPPLETLLALPRYRYPLLSVGILAALGGWWYSGADARQVRAIREATSRFEDVNVALEEGYVRDPSNMCITADMEGQPAELGTMGVHYLRPDLVGLDPSGPRPDGDDGVIEWTRPEVLIYEPQQDGSLRLVAVEWFVFERGWQKAGHREPPEFQGHPFAYMKDDPGTPADEAHGFMPHYELHAWYYRENPNGTYAPFNPSVTCEHHQMAQR